MRSLRPRKHAVLGVSVAFSVIMALSSMGVADANPAGLNLSAKAPLAMHSVSNHAKKGALKIVVSGSGSYTVMGKNYRGTGKSSRVFRVKTGTYKVQAANATVRPVKVKVVKGKVAKVRVAFRTAPSPEATPTTPRPTPSQGPPTVSPPPTWSPPPPPVSGALGEVQRVSNNALGAEANDTSDSPVWSPDGTRIAFRSTATNLVPGDTNGYADIFVKTLSSGAIERISLDALGAEANNTSESPVWSPDGTQIAFSSWATNLVADDTNGYADVFVKTLTSGAVERISVDVAGRQANGNSKSPAWSPDGSLIAFTSDASNLVPVDTFYWTDIFLKSLSTGAVQLVSTDSSGFQALGNAISPVWSPDGTRIAFWSWAANLVLGDTNGMSDVFVKDLTSGEMERVSVNSAGTQGDGNSGSPKWSPNGTQIAFRSSATNLVRGDTNGWNDVFVKTLTSGAVQRVSVTSAGTQGDGVSSDPAWSPDGTMIAFSSSSSNLVRDDTFFWNDVFVKTLSSGAVQRVSTDIAGGQANGNSELSVWSPDGTKIAFESYATNLVAGDSNASRDVLVKKLAQR